MYDCTEHREYTRVYRVYRVYQAKRSVLSENTHAYTFKRTIYWTFQCTSTNVVYEPKTDTFKTLACFIHCAVLRSFHQYFQTKSKNWNKFPHLYLNCLQLSARLCQCMSGCLFFKTHSFVAFVFVFSQQHQIAPNRIVIFTSIYLFFSIWTRI